MVLHECIPLAFDDSVLYKPSYFQYQGLSDLRPGAFGSGLALLLTGGDLRGPVRRGEGLLQRFETSDALNGIMYITLYALGPALLS